ncbi:hypothetical protein SLEP1_g60434 [Rubroshorea leprosula]|uniref:Uncharacterized protein n=1 Tax=Rubroshorea leprosula TaxID=152421 RepID=A0AAV5MV99_9ROSI|nr:hypothetical protein SLEP1_g60434 [Rubroshorea leprosula]
MKVMKVPNPFSVFRPPVMKVEAVMIMRRKKIVKIGVPTGACG